MWALSRLLTSQHSTALSSLAVALPCPGLPADQQQQAEQADSRLQHQQHEGGQARISKQPFTLQHTASLTPGIPCVDEGKYVESVVCRGPRSEDQAALP